MVQPSPADRLDPALKRDLFFSDLAVSRRRLIRPALVALFFLGNWLYAIFVRSPHDLVLAGLTVAAWLTMVPEFVRGISGAPARRTLTAEEPEGVWTSGRGAGLRTLTNVQAAAA